MMRRLELELATICDVAKSVRQDKLVSVEAKKAMEAHCARAASDIFEQMEKLRQQERLQPLSGGNDNDV